MELLNTKSAAIHVYFRGIDNVIYHLRLQCNRSNNTPKNIVTLRNDTAMTVLRTDPLLDTNPTLAIVYIVIVGIALLVGTCGNVLILRIFTVMGGINRSGKEFMMNLAIADLCVTAFADPLCIVGVYISVF